MRKSRLITDLNDLIQAIEELEIPFEKICEDSCGIEWNKDAKSFEEMTMDELDVITVIIEIENKFDVNVTDTLLEELITSTKPNELVLAKNRKNRLAELGI